LVGGLQKRGGGDERAMAMVVELRWRLGFDFEATLTWRYVGEVHPNLYRVVGRARKD
jgi:hypothetical protein